MLKIIGVETIAALAVLIAYELVCVKEKWEAIQSEKRWQSRMTKKADKVKGDY